MASKRSSGIGSDWIGVTVSEQVPAVRELEVFSSQRTRLIRGLGGAARKSRQALTVTQSRA
jgi:hypothetical protein